MSSNKRQCLTIQNEQKLPMEGKQLPPEIWIEIAKYLPLTRIIALLRTNALIRACALQVYNSHLEKAKARLANYRDVQIQLENYIKNKDEFALLALTREPNLNTLISHSLETVYDHICQHSQKNTARILIAYFGEIKDRNGRTLVHCAAEYGDIEILAKLVGRFGASVNIQDKDGYTPLHCAVANDYSLLTQLLIEHGADVNTQSRRGMSTPLHVAVEHRCTTTVQLLLESGANVNACDVAGETPLHRAFQKQKFTTLQVLMTNGANINIPDKNGTTPLHLALQIASCYIWHLATMHPNADFTCRDQKGRTPLYFAWNTIYKCYKPSRAKILHLILEAALYVKQISY